MYTPVNPSFTIQKWGVRGYSLHGHVFMMVYSDKLLCMLSLEQTFQPAASNSELVISVLSDHIQQNIFWLFRQVVAYCGMKVVQKAHAWLLIAA